MNSDFKAATTYPLKWEVKENGYAKGPQDARRMSFFIPEACMGELIAYLQRLQHEKDRMKNGKVYDYNAREEIELPGFYLNGKGRTGQYGDFGNMNLPQITARDANAPAQASGEIPF